MFSTHIRKVLVSHPHLSQNTLGLETNFRKYTGNTLKLLQYCQQDQEDEEDLSASSSIFKFLWSECNAY